MPELMLNPATRQTVIEHLERLLKAFHDAENNKEGGSLSISYRGQLGGFRSSLTAIVGRKVTSEILEAVREQTGLGFPHMGPVEDDGSIYNMDMEATLGL